MVREEAKKRLSIPARIGVVVIAMTGLSACPGGDGQPDGEQPCGYYCSSDAAVAESESDMFGGAVYPEFSSDAGDECHYSFC